MGKPEHYSADLPARCLRLLDELQPHAEGIFMPNQDRALGPLTATFALTMAIPIVNLPYERIYKPGNSKGENYADDRALRDSLSAAVKSEMSLPKLSNAKFFEAEVWSFATVNKDALFNIAHGLPEAIAEELSDQQAYERAGNMPVGQWISCLRNALAHGGIAYLDAEGFTSHGQPIQMYLFISGDYDYPDNPTTLIGLKLLRISQGDFVRFLHAWVHWLKESGLEMDAAA